jgi:hypothetical protein
MGLRLLVSYYDYNEAVIARAALDHAGIFAFVANEDLLRIAPYYNLAVGGFRLLVCEPDLEDAVSVLRDAVANPLEEGERLIVRADFIDRVMSFLWGWFSGGTPTPMREYVWAE